MPCPYYSQGWKECQEAKKKERKMLELIIHTAKRMITINKKQKEKAKEFFGPMVFSVAFITMVYSLTGIASMFYEK